MIAAIDMDSVTLDPAYQPPAFMAELGTPSAFNPDPDVIVKPQRFYRPAARPAKDDHIALTGLSVQIFDLGEVVVRGVSTFDPAAALAQELDAKAKQAQADQRAWQSRIETLRTDAEEDGYRLNPASERDFWQFIRSEPFIRKGSLVLLDNGNLRAMWKDQDGTHIGLQFLGGRVAQYVIFKHRAAAGAISRVAGRDSFEGVKRQIAAFDLRPLMYA